MISVESRDERRGIKVEFCAEKEMEATELEEGEALYFQNDDADSTIDLDIAFPHIDEKLQDVLGHHQKDFEGGVSAENLGAKFGGYGSFLPVHPWSPPRCQQKTATEVHDHNIPTSPNNQVLEASWHNSLVQAGSSLAMRPGEGSIPKAISHVSNTPSVKDQVKRDVCVSFTCGHGPSMKGELEQNSGNPCEQKILKVRIKVGNDNLAARRNSEIYSGLGLDASPSSSMEDSFTDSEGLSRDFRDAPDESPTSILKMMTSFLLHGGLLSPLSDDYMSFPGKEKKWGKTVSQSLHKAGVNGYNSRKNNQELLPEKKPNSLKKNSFLDSANGNASFLLKKEPDNDSLDCEELVSNALKLPLLSNTHSGHSESTISTATAVNIPRPANEGSMESNKSSYAGNSLGSTEEEISHKGQRNDVPNRPKSRRGNMLDAESMNPVKAKISRGHTSCSGYITSQSIGEEQLCMVGGNKLKGGQTHVVQNVEVPKDGSINDCISYERNKSAQANSLLSKSDSKNPKKGHRKAGDRYREFFSDLEHEPEDIKVAAKEMSSTEKLNGRKTQKPSNTEEYPRMSSIEKPLFAVSGLNFDANPTLAAPLVKEHWVQCDKCQKWRLLPLDTNPKSLPNKWVCSMLSWLPAMNRCNVSEEETTLALRAVYQAPAPGLAIAALPEAPCKQNYNPGKTLSGVSSGGVRNSVDNDQMLGQQALSTGGRKKKKKRKKKYKSKCVSNGSTGDRPAQFPNSVKKSHQVFIKRKGLDGMNRFPSDDEYGYQNIGQSTSSVVDKLGNKQTAKKNLHRNCSAAGDIKNSKMRSKGQNDIDSSRASKKVKTEDAHHVDGNCIVDQGGDLLKAGHCLSNKLPNSAPRKDQPESNNDSKNSKSDIPNNLSATEITSDDGLLRLSKCDSKSSSKKRKGHQDQDPDMHNTCSPSVGHHSQESCNDQRKEKKARISRFAGRDAITSKATGGIEKRAREGKDRQIGQGQESSLSKQRLYAADSLKTDPGSLQTSVAATSSSSKVSGSCQNKTNFQEVKASPVESVSSSPSRFSSIVKYASTGRKPEGRDKLWDGRFLDTSSPRRFLDGEDDGVGDQSGALKRNVTSEVNHHGSFEFSLVDLQDRESGFVSRDKIEENTMNESLDDMPSCDGKGKFQEKSGVSSQRVEKNFLCEKNSAAKDWSEIIKGSKQFTCGGNNGSDNKAHAIPNKDAKQNVVLDTEVENTCQKLLPEKADGIKFSGRGWSNSLPPSSRYKNDKGARLQPISGCHMQTGEYIPESNVHDDDTSRATAQSKKGEKQNETPSVSSRNHTVHKVRDHAGSPLRKNSSSQTATNAIKEAKDLKHLADRLKHSGSSERTGMYFEAALKFLYGASLLESGKNENSKHNKIQSMQVYSSTAKLCEFCAHEYERSKDLAAAALAYKCMEVAFMRVIYLSHTNASRDRNELQTALQIVAPGESPSSCVSDIDNFNNPVTLDKISSNKGVDSPQVAENHGITSQNRSSFMRILNFAQDVSYAMEAAKKAQVSFAAANSRPGESHCKNGISLVKVALNFNFHDVEELLRLVRIAMDRISR